jgi:hypothetical protein
MRRIISALVQIISALLQSLSHIFITTAEELWAFGNFLETRPFFILRLLRNVVLIVLVTFTVNFLVTKIRRQPPPLEKQVELSLKQLQENSAKSLDLLSRLQAEVVQRQSAMNQAEADLRQLRQERTTLELTDEQKRAVQSLVNRQQSTREMLTSRDFWIGKVLVSTVFLILGLIAAPVIKRLGRPSSRPQG